MTTLTTAAKETNIYTETYETYKKNDGKTLNA